MSSTVEHLASQQVGISADGEGITDTAKTSKLAMAAIALLIPGLLATIAPMLAVASAAAAILGTIALVRYNPIEYTRSSRVMAMIALLLGVTATLWGVSAAYAESQRENALAIEIGRQYLEKVATGDMLAAIQFAGLTPAVDSASRDTESTEQNAVRNYLSNSAITRLKELGSEAEWVVDELVTKQREYETTNFMIRYRDATGKYRDRFLVELARQTPLRYEADQRHKWLIVYVSISGR